MVNSRFFFNLGGGIMLPYVPLKGTSADWYSQYKINYFLFGMKMKPHLVGGFNPFEKYKSNWNLPQIGLKIKNI